MTAHAHPVVEQAGGHDPGDERRKREPFDQQPLPDPAGRADQDEVAGHMGGKEAEQRDEAERVDIACDRREKDVLAGQAIGRAGGRYLSRLHVVVSLVLPAQSAPSTCAPGPCGGSVARLGDVRLKVMAAN